MKIRSASIALAGSVILAACSDVPTAVQPTVRHSAAAAENSMAGRYILGANSSFGADLTSRVEALGGKVERVLPGSGIAVVTGISDAASAELSAIGGVSEVQPDVLVSLDAPAAAVEADVSAALDGAIASQANPATALRYGFQWNMRSIGADKAWAAGKLGSSSVRVAILDTGLDYDALDLVGLVDLSKSASFIASDDAITAKYFPTRHPMNDYHGHGTNVATQVSSKAFALAGVTSKTTLMGVKVLAQSGSGPLSSILAGVEFAADNGADIANMSLGGGFAKAGNGRFVGLINKTFNYAHRKGTLIIVAAGNATADLDHNGNTYSTYCNTPNVICVSSVGPQKASDIGTERQDTPSLFTNFGRSAISLAAPGGNYQADFALSPWAWGNDIASWVWSFCPKYRIASFNPTTGAPVLTACTSGGRLTGMVGTSQAAPHVAGLAALLAAENGQGNPQRLKSALMQSADDLGQPGTDPMYGKGRINVARALGL